MDDKWYDSLPAICVGWGALILGLGVGIGSCSRGCTHQEPPGYYQNIRYEKSLEAVERIARENPNITPHDLAKLLKAIQSQENPSLSSSKKRE